MIRSFDHYENVTLPLITGPVYIMPHFYGLLFILVLLRESPATSLTLRQPSGPTSSVNSTPPSNLTSRPLSLSLNEWDCAPFGVTPTLDFPNCLHATSSMPASSAIGLFHRSGATESKYRLPFTRSSVDCEVSVDFVDDVRVEVARWKDVSLKALEIVFGCVFGHGVGGYGLVGRHQRIMVSVRYVPEVATGN